MQHKNPIDIELVNASKEAYDTLARFCEFLEISANAGITRRLKEALDKARVEMQLLEDADRTDFVSITLPPGSMD